MQNSTLPDSNGSPRQAHPAEAQAKAISPWQRLKSKRISYLTVPLLVMATVTEFVILATGWKYQQKVCLPQGMGVTFFGIGPIGATILAVELLKLPLAIWTASRRGWQKGFMLVVGLPLICLLTFQLVKDMAVYEMGTAMLPANQMLEKATAEEVKIAHLNGALAAIEGKRAEREHKLAELAAKQSKAKAELEDGLKRNETARQDAINLTDYQKKELSEVESRQTAIIQQFASDTEQLTKAITDLRARREAEFARSAKDLKDWETRKAAYDAAYAQWHTEEARIDNAYKTSTADYANKKAAYEKDKAEYAAASFLHRQLMKEPVDPGVPPVREANKYPKPDELDSRPAALIAEIDAQIKSKEAELLAVNNKRRDRIAQVDADARRLREEFDRRSVTKREDSDRKREELTAALNTLAKEEKTEREQIDKEFATVVQKVDSIRTEVDACRKTAEGYYEAREAAIRKTQVHRIATTVEIVRGLIKGERPMSIKATAKERGDILTDQISMVRIWVYPVLAFIVAFLPTLMVEIGFSTIFEPEQQRAAHRLGFLGRRLHWLEVRAGRLKMMRAERLARGATAAIAARERALSEKEAELEAARTALNAAEAGHEAQVKTLTEQHAEEVRRREEAHAEQSKKKEAEWVAKLAGMADSLNRAIVEKDALRDSQKSEVEQQVQLRQNAWSERTTQLRRELDEQRAAIEAERAALREQHDELEKAARQEKYRLERQQLEFEKTLRQREEDSERRRKQREQELTLTFEARLAEETGKLEHQARAREAELEHELETRTREVDARWKAELQQQEEAALFRLKQREQQLQAQAEARLKEAQTQAEQELRRREMDLERRLEAQAREADTRLKQESLQMEELFLSKSRQRDQQWQAKLDAVRSETQAQAEETLRRREVTADAALRELEVRLRKEMQQKDEATLAQARQREQGLVAQLTAQAERRFKDAQSQWEAESEKARHAAVEPLKALLARTEKERDDARQSASENARQVQNLEKQLTEVSSFLSHWRNGKKSPEVAASQPGRTDWVLEQSQT